MTTLETSPSTQAGYDDSRLDELITEIRALVPMLRENAPEGERARNLTPAVEAELRRLDLFNLTMPTRWGGAGMSNRAYVTVQMELGKGDLSAAWVTQILNSTTWIASLGSDEFQKGIFGSGPTTICGAYNPPGIGTKVDGGYRVTGRFPYSSGSRQAEWAQVGFVEASASGPVTPEMTFAYLPMSQATIEDTWYVTGLQGTGSDTTVVEDVLVPDHLVVPASQVVNLDPNKQYAGEASDRQPLIATIRATGLGLLVGGAEAMLELVMADLPKKPVVSTLFQTKTQSQVIVHDIGKVAASLDTARLLTLEAAGEVDRRALSGQEWTLLDLAPHKARCAQVIELVHESVEKLMFIAGSSAFALKNPLSRFWKDLHMGMRHVQNIPTIGYEVYGRDLLGVTPNVCPPGTY